MFKKAINILFLIVSYCLLVFLLATLIRESNENGGDMTVSIANVIVFHIPIVLITFIAANIIFSGVSRDSTRKSIFFRIFTFIAFPPVSMFVATVSLVSSDDYFSSRYVEKIRSELEGDDRYGDVFIGDLSRSYLLFPYHPIGGSVSSEEDRVILNRILGNDWSPGFSSAISVRVVGQEHGIDSYVDRLNEAEELEMKR